jgi:hypothetical protein
MSLSQVRLTAAPHLDICSHLLVSTSKMKSLHAVYGVDDAWCETPKLHAKLAGEGIKYTWEYSKQVYRQESMKEKCNRE